jgi:hypothetical protein
MLLKAELYGPDDYYHQHNQFMHMTDDLTVTSFSASFQHKTRAAMDCLWQITLNQKLLHKFKK